MLFGHNFDIGQVCNYFKLKVSCWWLLTLLTMCLSLTERRPGYILWATWIWIHWAERDCRDWRTNWKVRVKFVFYPLWRFYRYKLAFIMRSLIIDLLYYTTLQNHQVFWEAPVSRDHLTIGQSRVLLPSERLTQTCQWVHGSAHQQNKEGPRNVHGESYS